MIKFKFDEKGLLPVVIQDAKTKEVLMLAYMNKQALAATLKKGLAHFWSRSRKKLWFKGESSGHTQKVKGIYVDCDLDALVISVEQKGGACHTGYRSCFYRKFSKSGKLSVAGKKVFDPNKVYG